MEPISRVDRILQKVRGVLLTNPDLRLGQLLCNSAKLAKWENPDLFYCPDYTLENGLDRFVERFIHEQ